MSRDRRKPAYVIVTITCPECRESTTMDLTLGTFKLVGCKTCGYGR